MNGLEQTFEIRTTTNPQLRHFMFFCAGVLTWLTTDLVMQLLPSVNSSPLITTYLLPLFGGGLLALLYPLGRQAHCKVPTMAALTGILFIVGGALFDLITTVSINPDLSLEANLYLRSMLDSNHSLAFVYFHVFVTQAIYLVLFCALWLTFLKHRAILIDVIVRAAPQTPLEFLRAATGGESPSRRQWIMPLDKCELGVLYFWIWPTSISTVFGISLLRWYVALEWLGVFEASLPKRTAVVICGVTGSLTCYFLLLWNRARSAAAKQQEVN